MYPTLSTIHFVITDTAVIHELILVVKRKAFSKHKAFSKNFILTDEAATRHTVNYINDTGRFKHVLGDIKAELIEDGKRD